MSQQNQQQLNNAILQQLGINPMQLQPQQAIPSVDELAEKVAEIMQKKQEEKEQSRRLENAKKAIDRLISPSIQEQIMNDADKSKRFMDSDDIKEISQMIS